jgi:hypothetical protein
MDFEGGERGSAMTWIGRHNSERKLRLSPLGAELAAETEAFFSGGYIKKLGLAELPGARRTRRRAIASNGGCSRE